MPLPPKLICSSRFFHFRFFFFSLILSQKVACVMIFMPPNSNNNNRKNEISALSLLSLQYNNTKERNQVPGLFFV